MSRPRTSLAGMAWRRIATYKDVMRRCAGLCAKASRQHEKPVERLALIEIARLFADESLREDSKQRIWIFK